MKHCSPIITGLFVPVATADTVVEAATANNELLTQVQDSLMRLPSAEDDVTILRVHDSCNEAAAKLNAAEQKTQEIEELLSEAESKVG